MLYAKARNPPSRRRSFLQIYMSKGCKAEHVGVFSDRRMGPRCMCMTLHLELGVGSNSLLPRVSVCSILPTSRQLASRAELLIGKEMQNQQQIRSALADAKDPVPELIKKVTFLFIPFRQKSLDFTHFFSSLPTFWGTTTATTGAIETIAAARIGTAVAMAMAEDMADTETMDGTAVGSRGRTLVLKTIGKWWFSWDFMLV